MPKKNEKESNEDLENFKTPFSLETFNSLNNKSWFKDISMDWSNVPFSPNYSTYGQLFGNIDNKNIEKLTNQLEEKTIEIKKLRDELQSKEKNDELLLKIQEAEKEQRRIVELKYLLARLHPMASNVLLEPENEILSNFSKNELMEMTVMSIDIRKSTNLMLKAITPDAYAKFISGLTEGLRRIVIENYGVFDKFTGDGILAYFPLFYSGEDSILNCCIASQKCHIFFKEFYEESYDQFNVVLDTGLGIGIDHGMVKIVTINREQTIVGSSVVYACRLSGAPATLTYLNRNAFSKIHKYGINTKEIKMDIKDEGNVIVYILDEIINKEISFPHWTK